MAACRRETKPLNSVDRNFARVVLHQQRSIADVRARSIPVRRVDLCLVSAELGRTSCFDPGLGRGNQSWNGQTSVPKAEPTVHLHPAFAGDCLVDPVDVATTPTDWMSTDARAVPADSHRVDPMGVWQA